MSEDKDDDRGVPYNKSPEGFWERKQTPSKNRLSGDANSPLVKSDKDSEADNYSYGQKGYPGAAGKGKGQSIWDSEPWKDDD